MQYAFGEFFFKPRLRNRLVMKFTNTKKTSFYTDFLTEDIIDYVEVKQIK